MLQWALLTPMSEEEKAEAQSQAPSKPGILGILIPKLFTGNFNLFCSYTESCHYLLALIILCLNCRLQAHRPKLPGRCRRGGAWG